MLALRQPRALRGFDRRVELIQQRARQVPLLESRGKQNRLERGPWLAQRLNRPVVLALMEVFPADERQHLARPGIDRHQTTFDGIAIRTLNRWALRFPGP